MTTHGQFHWNELMTRDVEKGEEVLCRNDGLDI